MSSRRSPGARSSIGVLAGPAGKSSTDSARAPLPGRSGVPSPRARVACARSRFTLVPRHNQRLVDTIRKLWYAWRSSTVYGRLVAPGVIQRKMDSGFNGRLSVMPLADLLSSVHADRRTGVLRFATPVAPASLWLLDGIPIDAAMGRRTGCDVLDILALFEDAAYTFTPGPVERAVSIPRPAESSIEKCERRAGERAELLTSLPPLTDPVELDEEALGLLGDTAGVVHVEAARFLRQGCSVLELLIEGQFEPGLVVEALSGWASLGVLASARASTSGPAIEQDAGAPAVERFSSAAPVAPPAADSMSERPERAQPSIAPAAASPRRASHPSVRPPWPKPSARAPGAPRIKVPRPGALELSLPQQRGGWPGVVRANLDRPTDEAAPQRFPGGDAIRSSGSSATAGTPSRIVPQRIVAMRPSLPLATARPGHALAAAQTPDVRPRESSIPPSGEYPKIAPLQPTSSRPSGVSIIPPPLQVRPLAASEATATGPSSGPPPQASSAPAPPAVVPTPPTHAVMNASGTAAEFDADIADLRRPRRGARLLLMGVAVSALVGAIIALVL